MLPHDAKRLSLDREVVQSFKSTLGILRAGEIDVSVAKGHTRNVVTKHTDGVDGADSGEDLVEVLFTNVLVEIADVKRDGGRRTRWYNWGARGESNGNGRTDRNRQFVSFVQRVSF